MKMNKKVTALGGLAALAVVGGTWAYFNQTTTIHNALSTKENGYGTITEEHFNPGSDWQPGSEVTKKVGTTNVGDYPVLVRVKMEEDWTRDGASITKYNGFSSTKNGANDNSKFLDAKQLQPIDGDTTNDENSVVQKNFDPASGNKWIPGEDGYWYYKGALQPKDSTDNLLESITLIPDVDMGVQGRTYKFAVTNKGAESPSYDSEYDETSNPTGWAELAVDGDSEWDDERWAEAAHEALKEALKTRFNVSTDDDLTSELSNHEVYMYMDNSIDQKKRGYSGAEYTLDITTEVIQATENAVKNTESWYEGIPNSVWTAAFDSEKPSTDEQE